MSLVDQIKAAGVVGAGGAGFPAHVKMAAGVDWMLANGAECEPLMHKDRELMIHFPEEIINGLRLAAQSVGSSRTVVGIKSKNTRALETLRGAIGGETIEIKEFGDYYPAGDEYEIVAGITGKLIPPGGIPLDVGCVVSNVETLYNIFRASQGHPVLAKWITIAGLVREPVTVQIPVGSTFADAIQLAGGPSVADFAVMESGVMMGKRVTDLTLPVTKRTGGLILLPADHLLINRYDRTTQQKHRIGHSACDQCTYCTELCPRYLLGYDIQPHLVMRSLGFSVMGSDLWNKYALLCCSCGLCSLYACPEDLYPREACEQAIDDMRAVGVTRWTGSDEVRIHPMKASRRVPLKQLMNKLGIAQFEAEAAFSSIDWQPKHVYLPLLQHLGKPAVPVVASGDRVKAGDVVADIPPNELGARVHASISGTVTQVTGERIVIEA